MKTQSRKFRKDKIFIVLGCVFLLAISRPIHIEASVISDDLSPSLLERYLKLNQEAEALRTKGQYEQAIDVLNKLLKVSKAIPDREKECDALMKLGLMYWNIGELIYSSQYYSEAAAIAELHHFKDIKEYCNNVLEIYSLYKLGKKYRSSNDTGKSIDSFQKAIELARSIKTKEHELKCLRQLSITYWPDINIHEYYLLNEKALEIARILNHKIEEGRCLKNIGLFYWKIDNYSQAINFFEKALSVARQLENKEMIADYLNSIGISYRSIGNYSKSLDYLTNAQQNAIEIGDSYLLSLILNNIGNTYRDRGLLQANKDDLYQALKHHEKSLEIAIQNKDIKTQIEVLNNLGSVNTDLENYSQALEYFQDGYQKAEEIHDFETIGMILNNIGIIYYNQGNYEESTEYYQKAIDLAQELEGGQILWEAYFEIGNSYAKQNKIFEALKNYKNSIRIIENIRSQIKLEELKASYLGTDKRIEAYQNLIHMLVTLNNTDNDVGYDKEAFDYLERAKARSFLDSLEVAQVDISLGINFKLKNREKEIMKDISNIYNHLLAMEISPNEKEKLHQELTEKENELETLKREIRSKSPDYADLRYPEIITIDETQKKLLDSKTAFIAYSIGNQSSYGFAVTKNSLKVFPVPVKSEIQNLVTTHLHTITDKDSRNFNCAKELFQILVDPGLDKKIKRIIFIPDDILHFLPFETLINTKDQDHWLIEDYKIAYAPSISSYREIIQRKGKNASRQRMDFLAFGDPDFGSIESATNGDDIFQNFYSSNAFNFYRLKYSGTEIASISSLFKQNKENIFVREAATEEQLKNLKLDNYKIIHFATHSLIDDKKPARSSIVLSLNNDTEEDGFVQMREIYNLDLNSDLVTLSACQTGLGQFIRGEGIEGLNRAFFFAGSSSVLMSLWAVNDQATYQLMERFYNYLKSSKQIDSSLQKAKLEMIASDSVSHPYFWAGFIITGKSDQVLFPNNLWKWILYGGSTFILGGLFFLAVRKNGYLSRHP